MRYVRGTALNAISDYAIAEGDAPQAGPGQVQIKVAACGIGYVDVLVALGGYQVKPALPHTPGQEIAGTVSAIGSGVTGLSARRPRPGGGAGWVRRVRRRIAGQRLPHSRQPRVRRRGEPAAELPHRAAWLARPRQPADGRAPGRAGRGRWRRHRRRADRQAFGRPGDRRGLDRGEAGLRAPRRRRPRPRQRRRGMARAAEGGLQRRRAGRDLRSVVRATVRAGLPFARLARAASRRRLRRRRDTAAARQSSADEGSGPGRRRRPAVRAVRTREGRCLCRRS